MKKRSASCRPALDASGFTLAEVAVTIVIVGIALTLVPARVSTRSKFEAALHAQPDRLARELGDA